MKRLQYSPVTVSGSYCKLVVFPLNHARLLCIRRTNARAKGWRIEASIGKISAHQLAHILTQQART